MLVLTYDSQVALLDDPNQASLRELTLSFDVPQTDAAAEPFAAWYSRASALAHGDGRARSSTIAASRSGRRPLRRSIPS